MTVSKASQLAALLAAGICAAGVYCDSTPAVALAAAIATGSVTGWIRSATPHDHWREYTRRRPWEP